MGSLHSTVCASSSLKTLLLRQEKLAIHDGLGQVKAHMFTCTQEIVGHLQAKASRTCR